jgi:hypothetical protein
MHEPATLGRGYLLQNYECDKNARFPARYRCRRGQGLGVCTIVAIRHIHDIWVALYTASEIWGSNGTRVGVMTRRGASNRISGKGRPSWAELRGPGWRTGNIFRRTTATFTMPSLPSSAASCRFRHLDQNLDMIRRPYSFRIKSHARSKNGSSLYIKCLFSQLLRPCRRLGKFVTCCPTIRSTAELLER